jgi:hypothetical protein
MDREHPQASGKSPSTDPEGSTPAAAAIVAPNLISNFHKIYTRQIRRPADSGDGEDEPSSSADPQARRQNSSERRR